MQSITRPIILYNRSNVVPQIQNRQAWDQLRAHDHFVLDALYIHAKPQEGANCPQVVFDFLTGLDTKGAIATQFFYEVLRSSQRKYYKFLTMLLAHSAQRCDQFRFETTLEPVTAPAAPAAAVPDLPPPSGEAGVTGAHADQLAAIAKFKAKQATGQAGQV
jgi:hypothetical protein